MAYNSKAIKTDVNAKPIPQYYNPVTDEYEVLQGTGGAARQVLYGPDGNPIATTEGKLAVKAEELETLLTALKEKDFATQATLATVLERLQAVEGKIDAIMDGTTPAKTELTGSKIRLVRNLQTLNDPIEPGQSENIIIFATAGHIATLNILSFIADKPDDATTGSHYLSARIGSGLSIERFLEFYNVYNARVLFNTYGGYEGSVSEERISASRQAINAGAIKFSDKIPLIINYRNDTDVVQTKTRYLLTVVTEEAYI